MSATFDSMASVRAIDAPSGSLTPAIRYSLSWVGLNPAGTALNIRPVAASSTAYTRNTAPRRPSVRETTPWYPTELPLTTRLTGPNSHPHTQDIQPDRRN